MPSSRLLLVPLTAGIAFTNAVGSTELGATYTRAFERVTQNRVTQDSTPLATITTDTGALAPGNREFSRFTHPGECIVAANIAWRSNQRSIATTLARTFLRDTAAAGDTLSPAAVAVARACLARFSLAQIAAVHLPDLFTLALQAGNDSLAHAVLMRRLALATSVTEQSAVLLQTVKSYIHAKPRRFAAADSITARIDALGPAAAVARMDAHHVLQQEATNRFDEAAMQQEAERIIALGQTLPYDSIKYAWEPILFAHISLALITYVESPDSLTPVIARAKADFSRFPPADEWPPGHEYHTLLMRAHFKTMSLQRVQEALVEMDGANYTTRPLPLMRAAYWFPKSPEVAQSGNTRPALVLVGQYLVNLCAHEEGSIAGDALRNECLPLWTWLPKWAADYGTRLPITIVAKTDGYAVRSLPLAPAAEADSIAWYLRDWLKLPVTVGVVLDSTKAFPAPDSRIRMRDTSVYGNLREFSVQNSDNFGSVLLYGANGVLRYVGDFNAPVLKRLIAREMKLADNASSTPPTR